MIQRIALCLFILLLSPFLATAQVRICVTTPELGDIVRQITGDRGVVTVFTRSSEDPHFVEARPSFVKSLSEADALVINGLELEIGWLPVLIQNSRNSKIQPGQPGYIDSSVVVDKLEIPNAQIDRSMGDVHPLGNPHYLLDPINGIRVADLIAHKLGELAPADAAVFLKNSIRFRTNIANMMFGEPLGNKYDPEKLAVLLSSGTLAQFLESQGEGALLSGVATSVVDSKELKVVADHNLWPYFAKRFRIELVAFLEPKPGVQPTTKHLGEVVEQMNREKIKTIFAVPYFSTSHAEFVQTHTGARIAQMAHQADARPRTESYSELIRYNVQEAYGINE